MGTSVTRVALVLTGGDPPSVDDLHGLPDDALVIAADSGLHHAAGLGLRVDVVVGDLDSADATLVAAAEAGGAVVERHPPDKDATDLELALEAARDRGSERVLVLGCHGGRVDHFLANALVLASPAFASMHVSARFDDATVIVVRDMAEIRGAPGEVVTLLALGGPAEGVTTDGLRFPLVGEPLHPGSTRGVSNELTSPVARVSLTAGVLLAILPGGPNS